MATFKDPHICFAPLEVIERLIEIKRLFGFPENLSLTENDQLASALQSFGFDGYRLSEGIPQIDFDQYQSAVVPSGDFVSASNVSH